MKHLFYCRRCWQEFDDPRKHNEGSWYKGERLDAPCKGEIQRADGRTRTPKYEKPEGTPLLDGAPVIELK